MADISVNGKTHQVDADPDTPLLWVLREWVGLTGTNTFLTEIAVAGRRLADECDIGRPASTPTQVPA